MVKVLGIIHINDATDSREKIQKAVAALNKKIVILKMLNLVISLLYHF